MSDELLLTLIWVVPLLGAGVILALPARQERAIKGTALLATALSFALTIAALVVYLGLRDGNSGVTPSLTQRAAANRLLPSTVGTELTVVQDAPGDLVVREPWVPYVGIQYFMGLDGINLSLLILTGFISVLACLASWTISSRVKGYFALFLILVASMMGVFLALDLVLFFVFFEVMLLPMYFLIAVWGGDRREYAAIKFLLFTLTGSVFILVGVLLLYFWSEPGGKAALHTFDMIALASQTGHFGAWIQGVIFLLFFVGFAVKLPSVPVHTWLPDAHVQAPTPISMILAGVLLKIGGYGFLRIAWPLAPQGAASWSLVVGAIGVLSILYGALVAMAQLDFKKLVAYSSVSHMGYVTLGMAAMLLLDDPRYYAYGVNGALFMMLAHGITSAGMFFLVGVIYDRLHTRDLTKLGGLLTPMPGYGSVSALIFFGSMGLPGLCGFVAEVFVVLAAFHYSVTLGVLAACAVVLTAGYILWTLQRVFLGQSQQPHDHEHAHALTDLTPREWAISAPLCLLTVALGVFPFWLVLSWAGPSVDDTVRAIARATSAPPAQVADAKPVR